MVEFWSNDNVRTATTVKDTELDFKDLPGKLKFGCNPASEEDCFEGSIK